MSIDKTLATAEALGLRLNNLFQHPNGYWWAEFSPKDGGPYGSYSAKGASAAEALYVALEMQTPMMEMFG